MKNASKVGLFFLIAAAIMTSLILKYNHIEFGSDYYTAYTFFDNVSGIEKNSSVKLAGMKIGYVSEILPIQQKKKIKIVLKIKNKYKIREDSEARLQMENIMGGKCVSISFGNSDFFVKDNSFIKSVEEADVEKLVKTFAEAAAEAKVLMKDFNANQNRVLDKVYLILNENQSKIRAFISNIDEITASSKPQIKNIIEYIYSSMPELKQSINNIENITNSIKNGKGTVGKLINEQELYNELTTTVSNIKNGVKRFDSIIARNENNIDSIIADVKTSVAPIRNSFENLSEITAKIKKGEGTVGRLINDTGLYESAKNSIEKLNENLETQREQAVMTSFTSTIFGIFKF